MTTVSSPAFWEDLYQRHGDGWELGGPAPALVDFVEATPPPRGRVAVPGCGRGHDAEAGLTFWEIGLLLKARVPIAVIIGSSGETCPEGEVNVRRSARSVASGRRRGGAFR